MKTSVAVLWPQWKTHGLALTRKSWICKCTAKDLYLLQRITAIANISESQ